MRHQTATLQVNRIKAALATSRLSTLEPAHHSDRDLIQPGGITQLPDRRGMFIADDQLGQARLRFLPDYYLEVFKKPPSKRASAPPRRHSELHKSKQPPPAALIRNVRSRSLISQSMLTDQVQCRSSRKRT